MGTTIEVPPEWYDEELEAATNPIKRRTWTDIQDAKLLEYYPRGVSLDTLARVLEHTEGAVRYRLHQLGIGRAGPKG